MSFKPANAGNTNGSNGQRQFEKFPTPEGGSQMARISLIVDLGIQNREDFVDPNTGESKPQKPQHQIAIFADLVDQVVDYGGEIGKKQYRLMLNKSFKGDVTGINFSAVPPRNADGKIIEGKMWTFAPASILTKLAKATGQTKILGENEEDNMNVALLLGQPLMIDVDVNEKDSGKKNDKGEPIIYTNVRAKGYVPVPKKMLAAVEELEAEPMIVTFDDATEEQVKILRRDIIAKIKQANNYAGSQIQKVLEGAAQQQAQQEDENTSSAGAEVPSDDEDEDDDVPF